MLGDNVGEIDGSVETLGMNEGCGEGCTDGVALG